MASSSSRRCRTFPSGCSFLVPFAFTLHPKGLCRVIFPLSACSVWISIKTSNVHRRGLLHCCSASGLVEDVIPDPEVVILKPRLTQEPRLLKSAGTSLSSAEVLVDLSVAGNILRFPLSFFTLNLSFISCVKVIIICSTFFTIHFYLLLEF